MLRPTCPRSVVSVPEYVGLHRHSPPRRQNPLVLDVAAETCLKVTAGDGGVKGRLCGTNVWCWMLNFCVKTSLWTSQRALIFYTSIFHICVLQTFEILAVSSCPSIIDVMTLKWTCLKSQHKVADCSSPVSLLQNSGEKEMSSTATRPPLALLKDTSKTTCKGRKTLIDKDSSRCVHADANIGGNFMNIIFHV